MFPRDIVCLRNMSISTLHKGDDDDDDDNNNNNNNSYFDVHRTVHRNIISIVKPTRRTNVSNLFYI